MGWYDSLGSPLPLIDEAYAPKGPAVGDPDEAEPVAAPVAKPTIRPEPVEPEPVEPEPVAPGPDPVAPPVAVPAEDEPEDLDEMDEEERFAILETPDELEPSESDEDDGEVSYIPEGTPVEEAVGLLGEKDRRVATEVERALGDWERRKRSEGAVEETAIEAELLRLIGERRSLLTAPDEVIALYVHNLRGGLFGLENLLKRPWVSDVLVNDWDRLFVEERGELIELRSPLRSPEDLDALMNRLVNRSGGSIDLGHPIFDEQFPFTTPQGEVNVRVNINLGSITVSRRPVISLRKPVASGHDKLEAWMRVPDGDDDSPLSVEAFEFLKLVADRRASMLIVGGTGSGKTSLMKAILGEIRPSERVVVVEEANELDLRHLITDYVGLRANDAENQRINQLVRSAMRMRPDRIIIGELREGSEVDGFLRAINTGHAGSISTIHASSAKDGLQALLTLAAQNSANKSSTEHIGRLIHPGIDLVIYLAAQYLVGHDGQLRRVRRVMEIATITEFRATDGVPDFILSHVFDRSVLGSTSSAGMRSIESPMRTRGYAGLSDVFLARMHSQGVGEAELRGVLGTPAR